MTKCFLVRALLAATLFCTVTGVASAQSVADYNYNPAAKTFAADSGNYGTRPSNAADGIVDPTCCADFYHNGAGDANGLRWWYVDLGSNYDITGMKFYFRGECCPTQNDGDLLQLWTSTPTFGPGPSAALFTATITYAGFPTQDFDMGAVPLTARYASIYAPAGFSSETIAFTELSVTATPEPASMVLLGSGLLAVGGLFRRRRSPGTA